MNRLNRNEIIAIIIGPFGWPLLGLIGYLLDWYLGW